MWNCAQLPIDNGLMHAHGCGPNSATAGSTRRSSITLLGDGGIDRLVEVTLDGSLTLTDTALNDAAATPTIDQLVSIEEAWLIGGSGNNVLDASGFTGAVALFGGRGHDLLIGGPQSDYLDGDSGRTVQGGNDTLRGGSGDDILLGGPGDDSLVGDTGRDTLLGEYGSDTLDAQDSEPDLLAGSGNGTSASLGDSLLQDPVDTIDETSSLFPIRVDTLP